MTNNGQVMKFYHDTVGRILVNLHNLSVKLINNNYLICGA